MWHFCTHLRAVIWDAAHYLDVKLLPWTWLVHYNVELLILWYMSWFRESPWFFTISWHSWILQVCQPTINVMFLIFFCYCIRAIPNTVTDQDVTPYIHRPNLCSTLWQLCRYSSSPDCSHLRSLWHHATRSMLPYCSRFIWSNHVNYHKVRQHPLLAHSLLTYHRLYYSWGFNANYEAL